MNFRAFNASQVLAGLEECALQQQQQQLAISFHIDASRARMSV